MAQAGSDDIVAGCRARRWRYGFREHGCPRALKAKAAHAGYQTYVAA